jgi:hypothetical protein
MKKSIQFILFSLLCTGLFAQSDAVPQVHESQVRLVLAFTPAAKAKLGAQVASSKMFQAIDDLNLALLNSNVQRYVQLVRLVEIDFVESADFYDNVHRFSLLPQIDSLRKHYRASIAALVLDNPSKCGLPLVLDEPAESNTAFCGVHWECMVESYGLAHMIGHLYGAGHLSNDPYIPKEDSVPPVQSDYAHGYNWSFLDTDAGFKTIMAQEDDTWCKSVSMPDCYVAPYFSSPDALYSGVPTGIPGVCDNARVISENTGALAALYPLKSSGNASDTIRGQEMALLQSHGNVSNLGSFWIQDQSRARFRAATKITLQPGFKADEGAYFETILDSAMLNMR